MLSFLLSSNDSFVHLFFPLINPWCFVYCSQSRLKLDIFLIHNQLIESTPPCHLQNTFNIMAIIILLATTLNKQGVHVLSLQDICSSYTYNKKLKNVFMSRYVRSACMSLSSNIRNNNIKMYKVLPHQSKLWLQISMCNALELARINFFLNSSLQDVELEIVGVNNNIKAF